MYTDMNDLFKFFDLIKTCVNVQLKEILVYVKLVYVCMHECYVIRW